MCRITIDGIGFDAPEGWTILETARFLGIDIPAICFHEGLSPGGGCRLCVVEIGNGDDVRLVSSCTHPVEEGLVVRTATERVIAARKMILELLIAQCPTSKTLQDLAAKMGLKQVRFTAKFDDCIYCGLCVRMCEEQMMASAIGFVNRGKELKITTPFDKNSEVCRKCGACMYICPACTVRCEGEAPQEILCGRCENALQPTCLESYHSFACWMGLRGECGTCAREKLEDKKEG
ncbi:MAG: (2Fe-2S)-binding protein [Deltaproteobacteria bacterium]|nr:MAG: (2Fe-2S)-binding protein [Deltaproteobacteria bacterium]